MESIIVTHILAFFHIKKDKNLVIFSIRKL